MLSQINQSMIRNLSLDLDRLGYTPNLVNDGLTNYHVESIGHVLNVLKHCTNQIMILFKKGPGDNVHLEFYFESDNLVHVDELSNCSNHVLADYFWTGGSHV